MNFLLDLLFPKKCTGCGQIGTYFCRKCVFGILQKDLICPACERFALGGQTHPVCKKQYGLDGLWSLGIYKGSLKHAIKELKYGRVSKFAEVLIDILMEYWIRFQPMLFEQIQKDEGQQWIVTAVPLHWWRDNSRGFNQSSLLGQILSKKLDLSYTEALKRIRYTMPQAKLKGSAREQNIKNAFALSVACDLLPVNCLLVDDVWTTGSTLRECCYVLKKAGAKKVWAITLAR